MALFVSFRTAPLWSATLRKSILLIFLTGGACSGATPDKSTGTETAPSVSAKREDSETIGFVRAQESLIVLKLLSAGKVQEAQARLEKIDFTGCPLKQDIIASLKKGDVKNCANTIDLTIDFWIIQESAHAQYPYLTVLLDNPPRLHFLQDLALYRASANNLNPESDKGVARILEKAMARGRLDEKSGSGSQRAGPETGK